MTPKIPHCVYCQAHGAEVEAVMGFDLPTTDGDLHFPLCNRHFEELRSTLNDVYDLAHPPRRVITSRALMN
jgi:hypothetical protein